MHRAYTSSTAAPRPRSRPWDSRSGTGCSYHGLALNIDMDLAPFADIDPCGYRGLAVTQLRDVGIDAPRAEIESRLVAALDAAIDARLELMSDDASRRKRPATPPASSTRATPRPRACLAIRHQDRAGRAIEKAGLDSRARAFVAALSRDQAHPARAQAAHGLRRSLVPEHRRVLRQGHGDVHDHGRHLHAPLPVLRRRPWPAAAAGRRRAGQSRQDHRRAEARLCRRSPASIATIFATAARSISSTASAPCANRSPATRIEVLVPDFRGRLDRALDILAQAPPDVMNHNLETVPRLYRQARPGSDYAHSLQAAAGIQGALCRRSRPSPA